MLEKYCLDIIYEKEQYPLPLDLMKICLGYLCETFSRCGRYLEEALKITPTTLDAYSIYSIPNIPIEKYVRYYTDRNIYAIFYMRTFIGDTKSKLHGKYTSWYKCGQIVQQGNFNRGEKEGEWKVWNKDGSLKEEFLYDNDRVTEYKLYNPLLRYTQRLNGEITECKYWSNGVLEQEFYYRGEQPVLKWKRFIDGKLVQYHNYSLSKHIYWYNKIK